MLEQICDTDHFKRTVTDFSKGARDHTSCRDLFKRVVLSFELFLEKSPVRVACDSATGNPQGVDALALYDVEDNKTVLVPVKLSKSTLEIGGDVMFMAHERAVPLLARKIIELITKMQTGAALTA